MAECMCDRHWTKITTAPAPHYTGGVTGKDKNNGTYVSRHRNLMMLLKQLSSDISTIKHGGGVDEWHGDSLHSSTISSIAVRMKPPFGGNVCMRIK